MSLICLPNNKYGQMQLIALNFKQYRERCTLGVFPLVLFPRPLFAFRILHFSIRLVLKGLQKQVLLEHGKQDVKHGACCCDIYHYSSGPTPQATAILPQQLMRRLQQTSSWVFAQNTAVHWLRCPAKRELDEKETGFKKDLESPL